MEDLKKQINTHATDRKELPGSGQAGCEGAPESHLGSKEGCLEEVMLVLQGDRTGSIELTVLVGAAGLGPAGGGKLGVGRDGRSSQSSITTSCVAKPEGVRTFWWQGATEGLQTGQRPGQKRSGECDRE